MSLFKRIRALRPGGRPSGGDTDDAGQYWEQEPDPLQAYFGAMGGGEAPRFLQRRGPARIYDDEIDPDWHDPLTDDSDEDED